MGDQFTAKCKIHWCQNKINAFDFQCGHNIPESKGGKTILENLKPICCRCNQSMGNMYSIDEWNNLGNKQNSFFQCVLYMKN
jgi:5-methylcytosine-specific restriction endonuclease McrA